MSDADDELMGQVFAGDVSVDHPAVEELFARRPELRETLRNIQNLAARLDDVGAQERRERDEWLDALSADEDSLVDPSGAEASLAGMPPARPIEARDLDDEIGAGSATPHHSARDAVPPAGPKLQRLQAGRWMWLAAAAVVVVGVALVWTSPGSAVIANEQSVLGRESNGESPTPTGEVADFDKDFRWDLHLAAGETFTVRILDSDGARLVFEVPGLTQGRWHPNPAEREMMPANLLWEAVVARPVRGGGTRVGTGLQPLSRSSDSLR